MYFYKEKKLGWTLFFNTTVERHMKLRTLSLRFIIQAGVMNLVLGVEVNNSRLCCKTLVSGEYNRRDAMKLITDYAL